ncbi:MAG: hypothetical protein QOI47_1740 [Actinomycetota bacterium]|nr:hypothetical protein [Actinomycetota bacterium]
MAFGQQSGPPASAKQVEYLLSLLKKAGHTGFRDARGALGFTQRQGAGKFTRDEASALIDQLLAAGGEGDSDAEDVPTRSAAAAPSAPSSAPPDAPKTARTIREIPAERLAAELERRGWTVTAPGAGP